MYRRAARLGDEAGFTMIELMIVMVMVSILSGIVMLAVGVFDNTAESSIEEGNAKQCEIAMAASRASYDNDDSHYMAFIDGDDPC